jgi:hypothetical protein
MARPRIYSDSAPATNAERQRAQRARDKARWVEVSRETHEAHTARLEALQTAIHEAARRGDTTAKSCNAASIETMLEKLAAHFESVL